MKEQYYLIPKSVVDKFTEFHKGTHWGHAANSLIEKETLVDLSDEAINETAATNVLGYDEIVGYKQALVNLKNKLNAK